MHLRLCEFRVISLLANQGKKVAEPYIKETDNFYRQNPESSTPEAWYGYKIMCCCILGDLRGNIAYVDSLMNYQKSLGLAIAHEITEMAGGDVYWDSTYQSGCRFVIEWPMPDKP